MIPDAAIELLRRIGRDQVLDITREIRLLREIKDVQDELNIMSIVFEDQRETLRDMARIIRSMTEVEDKSQGSLQVDRDTIYSPSEKSNRRSAMDINTPPDDVNPEEGGIENETQNLQDEPYETTGLEDERTDGPALADVKGVRLKDDARVETKRDQIISKIWKASNESHENSSSMPLFMVQLSIDEVGGMVQRAAKAYRL